MITNDPTAAPASHDIHGLYTLWHEGTPGWPPHDGTLDDFIRFWCKPSPARLRFLDALQPARTIDHLANTVTTFYRPLK